ncbi:MAG: amidohydrolase [Sphingobacteriaceae bacterium]|nr:amidohydrolase [Sphingobacteriaceae bacterium]
MNKFVFVFTSLLLFSCSNQPKQEVDLIIDHATVYTVDSLFTITEAIAVKDGKIIETGSNELINDKYTAKQTIDAEGKFIYPGFIDAHCHFYGYGKGLTEANLVGTNSYNEVLEKVIEHSKLNSEFVKPTSLSEKLWLVGRGWDQNDWEKKEFPTKEKLDAIFPDVPVFLKRIDGHAALVNQVVLDLAKLNNKTKINGGEFILQDGELTGLLVDNAVDSVEKLIPKQNADLIKRALLNAQKNCLAMGLTTVDDAGLEKNIIDAIDKLHKEHELKIRVYAMLTPTEENLAHYLEHGKYKTDKLNICSFKYYGDGALGSRGACLCKEYADKAGWKGFLLSDIKYFEEQAKLMAQKGFQMNTHCIGDSAARVILNIYSKYLDDKKDMRWRIEHAQVICEADFTYFSKNCLPSVQPTHATSDMYWAGDRLGNERVKNAYAYKALLKNAGSIPLGTDFPVEDINPFKTFYAAVFRKDAKGLPDKGYQMENALSREETLRGMTSWAAYSNFEEKEKGSLEKGKFADFIIVDTDLMKCNEGEVLKSKVISTWINGEKVFTLK